MFAPTACLIAPSVKYTPADASNATPHLSTEPLRTLVFVLQLSLRTLRHRVKTVPTIAQLVLVLLAAAHAQIHLY